MPFSLSIRRPFSLTEAEQDIFRGHLESVSRKTALVDMENFIQHGNTSCFLHSVAVAFYCYALAKRFKIKCNEKSLICGALLHDYFLYDWHVKKDKPGRFHGFTHPKTAWVNAARDFGVDKIEADIIKKHMFPLTPDPPRYRESLLVCLMDKACSLREILFRSPYRELYSRFDAGNSSAR